MGLVAIVWLSLRWQMEQDRLGRESFYFSTTLLRFEPGVLINRTPDVTPLSIRKYHSENPIPRTHADGPIGPQIAEFTRILERGL
jgi:hypothetical protein